MELQLQHEYFQRIFRIDFFRIDWFDLLAVQGTLEGLLQHHNSKASVLWHSAFFMVPTLTSIHDYWKDHSFDWSDFVSKVMSLLFNVLPRLVIAFIPRGKHLLISWLQSQSSFWSWKKYSVSLLPLFLCLFAMK